MKKFERNHMTKTHFLNIDKAEVEAMKNIIEKVDSAEKHATKVDYAFSIVDEVIDELNIEDCRTFFTDLQNRINDKFESKMKKDCKKITSVQDLIVTMKRIQELHKLLNEKPAYDPRIGGIPVIKDEDRRRMMHEIDILNKQVDEINSKNGF